MTTGTRGAGGGGEMSERGVELFPRRFRLDTMWEDKGYVEC